MPTLEPLEFDVFGYVVLEFPHIISGLNASNQDFDSSFYFLYPMRAQPKGGLREQYVSVSHHAGIEGRDCSSFWVSVIEYHLA